MSDGRPVKRPRVDGREHRTDLFDFVSQPLYESSGPADSTTPDSPKRSHNKKQPLSCAECRRLKLKCDRTFPCSSCQKRGCAQICPQGALTSGKGSRFILANTEELHAKIAEMSDRIQQLEDALALLQSSFSADGHPLLRSDLLRIKSSAELHRAQMTSSPLAPSPAIDEHQEYDLANISRSPSFHPITEQPHHDSAHEGATFEHGHSSEYPELPADLLALSENFPLPWSLDMTLLQRIREMLPRRSDAEYLCGQAQGNAFWLYNLDPSETFMPNLIHHVYSSPLADLSSRRLALLYIIMAIGLQVDVNQQVDTPRAEVYHVLARAAICGTPVMEHPDLDLMHTLFYMMWYLLVWSDKDNAAIYAWSVIGLAAKLAQALGLHRDGGGWKVIPEEVERRRFLFWELVSLDARLALSLGRPPSFNKNHIDAKRPNYGGEVSSYSLNPLLFLRWRHDLYEQCLGPVLEATVSAKPIPYSHILVLDSRVRDFYVPPELDMFSPRGLSNVRPLLMQQAVVSTGLEIIILQLHRNYFTQALNGPEPFTIKHKYAPSVIATYCSACRLINVLEVMMKAEPRLVKRVFGYWFNMFSGVVAICLLVSRAPHAPMSPMAIGEFQKARRLFGEVAEENPRAARAHALLERLIGKSIRILTHYLESRQDSSDDMDDMARHSMRAQPVTSDTRLRPETQYEADPFEHAHPVLLAFVRHATEQMRRQDPFMFIPDAELSLDEEDIRNGSFTTPTPTRVGNQNVNIDFGALTLGPDDQSLMTWF